MMRFIVYLKIQGISNLKPFKIYYKCLKFKNETFKEKQKCKKLVQIDHVIIHMFLVNYKKIQIIICNFYILNVYSNIFIQKFIINYPQH